MAIATALPGFSGLGRSVTPLFFPESDFIYNYLHVVQKRTKNQCGKVKKNSRSRGHRIPPSCGCKARETVVAKWELVPGTSSHSQRHQLSKGRETRCDKALRHVAATGCWNKSPRVTCQNHCRCDLSHEFKLVWIRATYRSDKISARSLVAPCVRICDKSLRPMRKHQLVSRHVKFELVYISSLPKSIVCTEQVSYRGDLSQDQCRRSDLSPRCVAATCRIVCLGLKFT